MRIKPASRIQEVKEYYFSRKLREIGELNAQGKNIINLGIGSPDLEAPEKAVDRLKAACYEHGVHKYQSYRGIPELRDAFAKWYNTYFHVDLDPINEILPLLGSKEGIMHISMTFLEAGDQVLVPNPGYPAYRSAAALTGAEVVEYQLSEEANWQPDLNRLRQLDYSRIKLMWVNYPHMPTGTAADLDILKQLVELAKEHGFLLVNDNPYSFILNDQPISLLSIQGAKEIALELNSLSKSHNMAGWRTGMLAGDAEYLNEIIKFKSNMDSGMFRAVQLAAVEALSVDSTWYDSINTEYTKRKRLAEQIFDEIDCQYSTEQVGMFVWAKTPSDFKDGYSLSDDYLYNANVFITPGGIFGDAGNNYVRLSLCSDEATLNEALNRIQTWNKIKKQSALSA